MKTRVLLLLFAALALGTGCGSPAKAAEPVPGKEPGIDDYYLRNWLCLVPVTISVADPNDPNGIIDTKIYVRLNLQTWLTRRNPEIDVITQGRPYGIGFSDDRCWTGNAVEVITWP